MSKLQVDKIYAKDALNAPDFPKGATVTGVVTATSFSGSGAALSNTPDVWNKPAAGINTSGSVGIGTTRPDSIVRSNNAAILNVGVVTANYYYGDGGNITGLNIPTSFTWLEGSLF